MHSLWSTSEKLLLWVLLLCCVLSTAKSKQAANLYFEFRDCGDGHMISFTASITPYPLIHAQQMNQWIGGRMSATRIAREFVQNFTLDTFRANLRTKFIIEYSSFSETEEIWQDYLGQHAMLECGELNKEFCEALYVAILIEAHNLEFFLPINIWKTFEQTQKIKVADILELLLEIDQFDARIRYETSLFDEMLICGKFIVRIQLEGKIEKDSKDAELANFKNVFSTPKFLDLQRNESHCPSSSTEVNGNCKCHDSRSGPFCIFRCNYEQTVTYIRDCSELLRHSYDVCGFEEGDYVKSCLVEHQIPVLDDMMVVTPLNLTQVNIHWQVINYIPFVPYDAEFTLYSAGEYLGYNYELFSYIEGMTNNYSLTKICKSKDTCSDLSLRPFTNYSVRMRFRENSFYSGSIFIDAGSTAFTSPEALAHEPAIEKVYRNGNQTTIEWKVATCTGLIRNYEAELWCTIDGKTNKEMRSGSLEVPYDCRTNTSGPSLVVRAHLQCEQKNLTIKLRLSTSMGFGKWSKQYFDEIKNKGLTTAAIAIIVGATVVAVILSVVVGVLSFKNYFKQKQLMELYMQVNSNSYKDADVELALKRFDPRIALIDQADSLPYQHRYEISFDRLVIGTEIGYGAFGTVRCGELKSPKYMNVGTTTDPVAIKQAKEGNSFGDLKALLDELKIMMAIGVHVNLVRLIGAVTKRITEGELYIVLELCTYGSVLSYLHVQRKALFGVETVPLPNVVTTMPSQLNCSHILSSSTANDCPTSQSSSSKAAEGIARDGLDDSDCTSEICTENSFFMMKSLKRTPYVDFHSSCSSKNAIIADASINLPMSIFWELLSFGYQVANGMMYISEKNVVHRDLAARNILLTSDKTIKIADCGLARVGPYKIHDCRKLPIDSMALETFADKSYSTKSDIWSYGVLLWEFFSLGNTPYSDISLRTVHDYYDFLKKGNRLSCPPHSPPHIYENLMIKCWLEDPMDRPSFAECRDLFEGELFLSSPSGFTELQCNLNHPINQIDQRTAKKISNV